MKLVIVGPGFMPIPPKGWGAVESLIWDYKQFLDKYHPDITTVIVNVSNPHSIIQTVNNENPDIVHIQYDDYAALVPHIKCKHVLLTSHYAYISQYKHKQYDGYFHRFFPHFVKSRATILALSKEIMDVYHSVGVPYERMVLQHNGANEDLFRYAEECKYPERSIYLAKVDARKRQYNYQHIDGIYFAGNIADSRFNTSNPRYLGEWTKPVLYDQLTDYANLVLLSDGEAHPLVVCEALIAGLGVVVSEVASANLDRSLPFIDVIPMDKLDDIGYISEIIKKNREISCKMRTEIREYGLKTFSWKVCVERYACYLRKLLIN